MRNLRIFLSIGLLGLSGFAMAVDDPCEDSEIECLVVYAERPSCPEGWTCYTPDGLRIFSDDIVNIGLLPDSNAECGGLNSSEVGGDLCAHIEKKKTEEEEEAEEVDSLPDCNDIVYSVADAVSYSGVISGSVSGWHC